MQNRLLKSSIKALRFKNREVIVAFKNIFICFAVETIRLYQNMIFFALIYNFCKEQGLRLGPNFRSPDS